MAIITKGDKGSVIKTKDKRIEILIVKPNPLVDPTGAGDAYRVGIIKGLLYDWSLKDMGNVATNATSPTMIERAVQLISSPTAIAKKTCACTTIA